MWITQATYTALVSKLAAAETQATFLLARVNQLEQECGQLRHKVTGEPQVVPQYTKNAAPPAEDPAEVTFEDLGDDLARKYGVSWDDHGRVQYAGAGASA